MQVLVLKNKKQIGFIMIWVFLGTMLYNNETIDMNKKKVIYEGFSWVLKNELCGMPQPGISGSEEDDIRFLQKEGITILVSLTLKTPDLSILITAKIGSLHFPVKDFFPPEIKQLYDFSLKAEEEISKGGRVGVHCFAGKGRTGTFLAAYLVYKGAKADDAITKIRELRPGSIETEEQENAVKEFAEFLKKEEIIRKNQIKISN